MSNSNNQDPALPTDSLPEAPQLQTSRPSPLNNNQAVIDGLRALADFLEQRPQLPVADRIEATVSIGTKEQMAALMRAMEHSEKMPPLYPGDQRFRVRRMFGPVELQGWCYRTLVCKKVTVLKEVEEWECPESILADVSQDSQKF